MTQQVKLRRVECNYQSENARFLLECDFSKQYNSYYRRRLEKTRPYLEFNARYKWDPNVPICNLAQVPQMLGPSDTRSAECIVIGTIFKRMKLQPDVVEELSKGNFHVKCERYLGHYTSKGDTLILEDTEESISLVGAIDPKKFVTGICVALLGYSIDDGSQFFVKDICYAEPNRSILFDDDELNQMERPELPLDDRPVYLMVVSGLGFHHEMDKKSSLTQALQDMIDFIWGGGRFEQDDRSHRIARILVLGDNLHADRIVGPGADDDHEIGVDQDDIGAHMRRSRQVKQYSRTIRAVEHMDEFFAQLSKTIKVDVMPGPSDPSSHLMPQQPFHPCMFPKSCVFSTFNCTTNPHHAIYHDEVEILASAGQNVDIIKKFSGLQDSIEIMKNHIKWGSSAPSAPDNLYSAPYEEEDPYVIDFIPDIYIVGCQDSYKTDYYCYDSNEPGPLDAAAAPTPEQSFESTRTESTIMNVTAESLEESGRPNLARPSDGRLPPSSTPPLSSTPAQFSDDCSPLTSSTSSSSAPSSYAPNQLALQRREQLSLLAEAVPRKSRTLLITVPKFHQSFSCVLIDLNSVKSEAISFAR